MLEGYYLWLAVRGSRRPAGTLTHIFWFEFLVAASNGRFLQLVNNGADHLLIFQSQLLVDDLHVPHWVNCSLNMDDILILKCTCSNRTQTRRALGSFYQRHRAHTCSARTTKSMTLTFWRLHVKQ